MSIKKTRSKLNHGKKALFKERKNPEGLVQGAIIKFLEARGWYVKEMHASSRLSGFPDLFATHIDYGYRLIEVKLPNMEGSKFTPAQIKDFPKFTANGAPIWIMTSATEKEYQQLFTHKEGNLASYFLRKL